MSNFTPLVTREYEFEGDKVTISFSRLKRKHMLEVMPYLSVLAGLDEETPLEDYTEEQQGALNEVINSIIDVIPDYVHNFEGLLSVDNSNVGIETVVDDFYFLALASMIALDMVKESSPVKEGNA
jgi:hypothetical protein